MENMGNRLISRHEAADIASVTVRTIKRWAVAGKLRTYRDELSGRVFYDREELVSKLNGG